MKDDNHNRVKIGDTHNNAHSPISNMYLQWLGNVETVLSEAGLRIEPSQHANETRILADTETGATTTASISFHESDRTTVGANLLRTALANTRPRPSVIAPPPRYSHIQGNPWIFDTNAQEDETIIFSTTFKPFGLRYRISLRGNSQEQFSTLETTQFGRTSTDAANVFDLADVAAGDLYEWLRDCARALDFVETLDFEGNLNSFVSQLAAANHKKANQNRPQGGHNTMNTDNTGNHQFDGNTTPTQVFNSWVDQLEKTLDEAGISMNRSATDEHRYMLIDNRTHKQLGADITISDRALAIIGANLLGKAITDLKKRMKEQGEPLHASHTTQTE